MTCQFASRHADKSSSKELSETNIQLKDYIAFMWNYERVWLVFGNLYCLTDGAV